MGWNNKLMIVGNRRLDELLPRLPIPPARSGEMVDSESAMGGAVDGIAAAEIGPHVVLWDRWGRVACSHHHSTYEELSRRGPLFMAYLKGVSSSYGISYYEAGGLRRYIGWDSGRERQSHQGLSLARGAPLPAEADIAAPAWGYDENWVFTLAERLMNVPFSALETQYAILR